MYVLKVSPYLRGTNKWTTQTKNKIIRKGDDRYTRRKRSRPFHLRGQTAQNVANTDQNTRCSFAFSKCLLLLNLHRFLLFAILNGTNAVQSVCYIK